MANLNRRDFVKVLGTVTVAGCDVVKQWGSGGPMVPFENVLPYVVMPDQTIPGLATWFTSSCEECAAGCGTVARNREGRIVKLEGNPNHPTNQGSLCARGQAGILSTYSPDRFDGPWQGTNRLQWDPAAKILSDAIAKAKADGKAVAWLGQVRTGSLAALIRQFVAAAGGTVLFWDPLGPDALREAVRRVYGVPTIPTYELGDAHVILSFGADFLQTWLDPVGQAKGYAQSRNPEHGGFVGRLVCIEPRIGNSSANCDTHYAPKPGTEVGVAMALCKLVAAANGYAGPASPFVSAFDVDQAAADSGIEKSKLEDLAKLLAAAPATVVLPGGEATSAAPTDLAIASLLLNEVLGNVGKSVRFGPEWNVEGQASFAQVATLLQDVRAGKVGVLLVDGLDPVHALPLDAGAKEALGVPELVVAFANEPTDSLTDRTLVLPPGTTLENWTDNEAIVGRYTIGQPAMLSMKDTRAIGDVLLAVAKTALAPAAPPSAITAVTSPPPPAPGGVQPTAAVAAAPATSLPGLDSPDFRTYQQAWWTAEVHPKAAGGAFADFWNHTLERGGFFLDAPPRAVAFQLADAPNAAPVAIGGAGDLVLALFPHPFLLDGRHANKPWSQEIPEPISTFTWSTWVELNPKTAERLGLEDEDAVTVTTEHGKANVSWFRSPGIREDTVAIVLGNGHEKSGRYTKYGSNPMRLVSSAIDTTSGAFRFVSTRAKVARSGTKRFTKPTAGSLTQEERPINYVAPAASLGHGDGAGSLIHLHGPPVDERLVAAGLLDFYPEPEHPTYRFAMSVDLNSCTGCGACEAACYAENNIPIVGPAMINKSRLMGWIRLSRYWEGEGETPDIRWQPVMCQHCSHAPCEAVCPVLATYHNLDGLNAMIYNRCVGTRYCGNNCPYSARRFNYHSYDWPEPFHMMLNPDVTVRDMGVMEKCTFCIQRIRDAKDLARDDGHRVATDAELQKLPACARACPADAIVFGNKNDGNAQVAKNHQSPRSFYMLTELNTKPGVKYLARLVHHEVGEHEAHASSLLPDPATGGLAGTQP